MSQSAIIPMQAIRQQIARRPALAVAAIFATGIAGHRALPQWPGIWLAAVVIVLILAFCFRRRALQSSVCIVLAIALCGLVAGQLALGWFPANHVALFSSEQPHLGVLEIELIDTPRVITGEGPRHGDDSQHGNAVVKRVKTIRGWENATGDISFTFAHPEPALRGGQRLRVLGMLERPAPAMNPGAVDWQHYYRQQRVLATVHVSRACDLEVIGGGHGSVVASARERVRGWLRSGFSVSRMADRELLAALILGERGPAIRPVEDDFNTTGATHLLASSGLRVGMLASCLYGLARLLRLRPRTTAVAVSLAVMALGMVMLPTAQAIRPVIAVIAVTIALMLKRSIDAIQFLGLAALVLLVIAPLELYSAGFQLTFVVVLGLLSLTPPVVRYLEDWLRNPDIDVLEKIGRLSGRQRAWRWTWRRGLQLGVAGVIAWIVSMPLVAYHFEQLNPWSVLVGLVLLPFTLLSLAMGFVKVALTAILPFGSHVWAMLPVPSLWCLRHGIAIAARLPGADIPTISPSPSRVFLFYGLLLAACLVLAFPWSRARLRWAAGCGLAGACGMSLFLPALVGFAGQSASVGEVRITLLSVGAGQCAAVETPDGKIFFFDAGSSTLTDPLRTCIGPFLRHEGRASIDAIYLSHGDFDHINAAGALFSRYGASEVLTNPVFSRHAAGSATCRTLLTTLTQAHHPPHLISAGQTQNLGGGATAEIVWPPANCSMDSNNAGVVMRLHFAGRSILFPADIQAPAETELLKHPENLTADILVAPHHGSSEITTPAFIRAVDPKFVVSSDGHRLSMKQKTFEKMLAGTPLYRTGQNGAITILIDPQGNIRVETFLPLAK